ncbi:MAG: hypothetical protein PF693_17190, partial [Spirochaetia bacterium]|nr:hypothetical protein [Spirochaetia bacterium]
MFKKKLKMGGFFLPLLIVIILFSTCGITVYYYFNPPVPFPTLSFYHAHINDPNFAIGYDFFYRIYDGDITTESTVISEAN